MIAFEITEHACGADSLLRFGCNSDNSSQETATVNKLTRATKRIDRLERLADLRDRGLLSESAVNDLKQLLLNDEVSRS